MDEARLLVVRVLHEVIEEEAFSNESLDHHLRLLHLDARQRAFATAGIYGTLSLRLALDSRLNTVLNQPLGELDPWVRNILRFGLWQLDNAYGVPAHAAVAESVELCRALQKEAATGLVNAVLRRLSKEPAHFRRKDEGLALGLGNELFGLFKHWFGKSRARALAEAFLQPAHSISLRVNRRRSSSAELAPMLQAEDLTTEPGRWYSEALRVRPGRLRLDQLPSYAEGLFMVQDEAAQTVGVLSGAEQVHTALDLCAAPGGKTLDLAERLPEGAALLGVDLSAERLSKAVANAARLRLPVQWLTADVADPALPDLLTAANAAYREGAELVLLDVPCSGLGLLGRKPELRWRMDYQSIQRFPELQQKLLRAAAALTRPGGRLIYSTCTLDPQENEEQMRRFLGSEPGQDFHLLNPLPLLPPALAERLRTDELAAALLEEGFLQFRPDLTETDGFFIAVLSRTVGEGRA